MQFTGMQSFSSDLPKIEEFIDLSTREMLEIGCGDGRLSSLLADKVKSLTAIDPDQAMINQARKEISDVDFRVGYGEKLEFNDRSYDIILFSYSLHHQDCVKALDEAKRVLRDNGSILIIEPSTESEYTQLVSIFQKNEINRLNTTLAYIKSGNFDVSREDVYFVNYHFKDDKELYRHFMNYSINENNAAAMEKMKAILGSKKSARPIVIKDKVNIILQKF
jgi:ubiquinone/menaquinone biosynthesis C-methylase UbiE